MSILLLLLYSHIRTIWYYKHLSVRKLDRTNVWVIFASEWHREIICNSDFTYILHIIFFVLPIELRNRPACGLFLKPYKINSAGRQAFLNRDLSAIIEMRTRSSQIC